MAFPPFPSNGETNWGNKMQAWSDAVETQKVEGTGLTLRYDTSVGTRVLLDHPGGTTTVWGDTGWRDVTSWDETGTVTGQALPIGVEPRPSQAGFVRWRRTTHHTTIWVRAITFTSAGDRNFMAPQGFRFPPLLKRGTASANGGNKTIGTKVNGFTYVFNPDVGDFLDQTYGWAETVICPDPWPTTLPGTPA